MWCLGMYCGRTSDGWRKEQAEQAKQAKSAAVTRLSRAVRDLTRSCDGPIEFEGISIDRASLVALRVELELP